MSFVIKRTNQNLYYSGPSLAGPLFYELGKAYRFETKERAMDMQNRRDFYLTEVVVAWEYKG